MGFSLIAALFAAPAAAQVVRAPVRAGAAPIVAAPAASVQAGSFGLGAVSAAPLLRAPALSVPVLPSAKAAPSVSPQAAASAAAMAAPAAAARAAVALPRTLAVQAPVSHEGGVLGTPGVQGRPAGDGLKTLARTLRGRAFDSAALNAAFDGGTKREAPVEETAMTRPSIARWSMLGREYKTTDELLAAVPDQAEPVPAVYTYGHNEVLTRSERRANAAIGAAAGAIVLAEAGAVLAAIGGVLGPLLDVFLGGTGAATVGLSELLAFAGVLGGLGALAGFVMSREMGAAAARIGVSGEILRYRDKLFFRPSRDKAGLVDLAEFAKAPLAPEAPVPSPWPLWKRAGAGAALGLGVALATGFPLLQIIGLWIAGPAAGMMVGAGLSGRSEVAGSVLGGTLGTLVPVSYFTMLGVANAISYGAVWGAMGLWLAAVAGLGSVIGAVLGNPIRRGLAWREGAFPQSQWWARGQQ